MTSQMNESPRFVVGVVDVGSNSIKLTVATIDASGQIDELGSAMETVRLGSELTATGRLADDRIDAAIDATLAVAEVEVVDLVLPGWHDAARAGTTVLYAEAWRSDGAVYEAGADRLGADVRERLERGRAIPAAGHLEGGSRQ